MSGQNSGDAGSDDQHTKAAKRRVQGRDAKRKDSRLIVAELDPRLPMTTSLTE